MNLITPHRHITRDPIFRLLFFNMALVILGYAIGVLTGLASVGPMRVVKYSVLLGSILYLSQINILVLRLLAHYLKTLFTLSATFLFFALLTESPSDSLIQVLTYIIPFLYVAFSLGYLLLRYPLPETLHAFISAINWVYLVPIVSFFATGGKLTDTNIYFISAENEDSAFVSNHYGWSGTLFLLSGLDLLRNASLPRWRRVAIITFGLIAAYLVLISGNRTSWLSLVLVGLIFIFRYRSISIYQKVLLFLIPLGMVYYLSRVPSSALNSRFEKTEKQQKKGEPRLNRSATLIEYFNANPALWVTGIGMFNKKKVKAITGWAGYHNSYFEVLFGAGIVVFTFFMYIIVVRPFWYYIRYFSTHYLFFLPLLIIPYFESNLTGGQFLFFPWFISTLLMSYSTTFAETKKLMSELPSQN